MVIGKVVEEFVQHYYKLYDANRADLVNLYQEGSILTFEGEEFQGRERILAKLTSTFPQCWHYIDNIDCLPSDADGVFVVVTGGLVLSGRQNRPKFRQMFHLKPAPQGSFCVVNDIYRLKYA